MYSRSPLINLTLFFQQRPILVPTLLYAESVIFTSIPSIRTPSRHNNWCFGGLAVLRKDNIKNHVKILPNDHTEIQWIKVEKDYFGFSSDICICLVCNPPSISTFSTKIDEDILEKVESDIIKYKTQGEVIIFCGDLKTLSNMMLQDMYPCTICMYQIHTSFIELVETMQSMPEGNRCFQL